MARAKGTDSRSRARYARNRGARAVGDWSSFSRAKVGRRRCIPDAWLTERNMEQELPCAHRVADLLPYFATHRLLRVRQLGSDPAACRKRHRHTNVAIYICNGAG